MLDVHPPHHSPNTFRDFLLHIATIVVGLLIAISLEQSVEYLHRKHEVAETRRALDLERRIDRNRFAAITAQFERFVPVLQRNLAIFVALKQHPGSAASLPQLDWNCLFFGPQTLAWDTAKQNNVLESMPVAEARKNASLYDRLEGLSEASGAERQTLSDATLYAIADPDPSHLSSQQLDHEIELTSRVIQAYTNMATQQNNLSNEFPDFSPAPSRQEILAIRHQATSQGWTAYSKQVVGHVHSFDEAQTTESSPSK